MPAKWRVKREGGEGEAKMVERKGLFETMCLPSGSADRGAACIASSISLPLENNLSMQY
jgi:hypothetical protein